MKSNMRKALAISGMAIILGTSGIILDASASTIKGNTFRHERGLKGKVSPKTGLAQRHRKGLTGIVVSVSGDSATITRGGKTFTITKSDTTRIFNKAWKNVDFSTIQAGDKIVVHGTLTETTITARTIRDITH